MFFLSGDNFQHQTIDFKVKCAVFTTYICQFYDWEKFTEDCNKSMQYLKTGKEKKRSLNIILSYIHNACWNYVCNWSCVVENHGRCVHEIKGAFAYSQRVILHKIQQNVTKSMANNEISCYFITWNSNVYSSQTDCS